MFYVLCYWLSKSDRPLFSVEYAAKKWLSLYVYMLLYISLKFFGSLSGSLPFLNACVKNLIIMALALTKFHQDFSPESEQH